MARLMYSIKHTAKLLWDIDINAKVLCIDHSDPLRNGVKCIFPNIEVTADWPHIARKIKTERARKITDEGVRAFFKEGLEVLHMCRTKEQFLQFAGAFRGWMHTRGEGEFTDTFMNEYGTEEWCGWFYGAVSQCGFTPATQAQESHNKTIKTTKLWKMRSSID